MTKEKLDKIKEALEHPLNPHKREQALKDLEELREEMEQKDMKTMGMLNVLCECHVFVPEEQAEMIQDAVTDNLPEGWAVKRTVNRLELVLPQPPKGDRQMKTYKLKAEYQDAVVDLEIQIGECEDVRDAFNRFDRIVLDEGKWNVLSIEEVNTPKDKESRQMTTGSGLAWLGFWLMVGIWTIRIDITLSIKDLTIKVIKERINGT